MTGLAWGGLGANLNMRFPREKSRSNSNSRSFSAALASWEAARLFCVFWGFKSQQFFFWIRLLYTYVWLLGCPNTFLTMWNHLIIFTISNDFIIPILLQLGIRKISDLYLAFSKKFNRALLQHFLLIPLFTRLQAWSLSDSSQWVAVNEQRVFSF